MWSSSGARPAASLKPGVDLVLEVEPADGLTLASGVALEDYLSSDTRHAIDAESRTRYERWRAQRAQSLTIDGVDLTHIWEVDLLAECFLPAARIGHALPLALASTGAKRLLAPQMDSSLARLLAAVAEPAGTEVIAGSGSPVEPRFIHGSGPSRLVGMAARLGVPALIRGEVMALAYWNTMPLRVELARRRTPKVVSSPLPLRDISRLNMRSMVGGGWTGIPGPRARASSRTEVSAALEDAPEITPQDALDEALDRYALEILGRMALETLAPVRHVRGALRGGKVRLALLPFDSPPQARMSLVALQEAGVRTLLIQHGFSARMGDPDMSLADHLAIWSERDRALARARAADAITVTGNPGASHLAGAAPRRRKEPLGLSVVLVDYPGRLSTCVGGRVTMQHVQTALQALATARPGSIAVVRPHPSDQAPEAYAGLGAAYPELKVEVDMGSPIEALLGRADLCVGAISTATLQACALGVPTVFLDVSGVSRPWPFQAAALPHAIDVETLEAEIVDVMSSHEVAGRDGALEALGARPDAVERVIELMADLMRR